MEGFQSRDASLRELSGLLAIEDDAEDRGFVDSEPTLGAEVGAEPNMLQLLHGRIGLRCPADDFRRGPGGLASDAAQVLHLEHVLHFRAVEEVDLLFAWGSPA